MHIPVMLNEVKAQLNIQPQGVYVDATFGGGGYTKAILDADPTTHVYATDRDPDAIARGQSLQKHYPNRLVLQQACFSELIAVLKNLAAQVDGVVFDLGVSSFQIDSPDRGFSFRHKGPLDMRMTPTGPTAADLVNTLPEAELADIIFLYGEERYSRRVARAIVQQRQLRPYTMTQELAETVRTVVKPTGHGIDPATRTFQALRIAVNQELDEIKAGLKAAAFLLKPHGRVVVVSFHSLEDRLIKHALKAETVAPVGPQRLVQSVAAEQGAFKPVQRKAMIPNDSETAQNPRSRSAKLRVAERTSVPFIQVEAACND